MTRALRLGLNIVLGLIAAAIVFSALGTLWVLADLPMGGFAEAAFRMPEAGLLAAFFGVWALGEMVGEAIAWRRWLLVALVIASGLDCAARIAAWSAPPLAGEIGHVTAVLNWIVGAALAAALVALALSGRQRHPAGA